MQRNTNILEVDQPTYQWFLMDDIAKRGMLSFGCRGIPTYRRRTNQPNQWFLMDDIAKRELRFGC